MERFDKLKHIFTVLISTPAYPNIERFELQDWTQEANIVDKGKT